MNGINGSNIVGFYTDGYLVSHGFLYNGSTWTTLDMPGAYSTYAFGIDGNHIVGYYDLGELPAGSFLYTIPEPSSLVLFMACLSALMQIRRVKHII
jgi:hypothetical protein